MFSTIDRTVVYPISTDIIEHDINIVSDLWTMAGRQVYRGGRDPSYTHANVYWLYDPDDLDRVGVSEHRLDDPADVALLWYKEDPFGTLLQEDGWTEGDTIWGDLPTHVYEQCLAEEWTTPKKFLERCLRGPARLFTPDMLINTPKMYSCSKCNRVSLDPFECGVESAIGVPEKEKVFFIDDRMVLHSAPKGSSIWSLIGFTTQPQPSEPSSPQVVQRVEPLEEVSLSEPSDAPPAPPAPPQETPQ